jgi:hypothetical protein
VFSWRDIYPTESSCPVRLRYVKTSEIKEYTHGLLIGPYHHSLIGAWSVMNIRGITLFSWREGLLEDLSVKQWRRSGRKR